MIILKAVAYVRYSSDKQREESIAAQMRAIYAYAQKNNIQIIKEYADEAQSATDDDRKFFQKMMRELPEVKPDLVLVHKLDRFARNRYDSAIYRRELQKSGARLLAVEQPIDDTPEGVILESLLEGMAEYYSKNLAREVMKGMKENAYEAKFNGGWVPLGYDVNQDKRYIINEAEAVIIRLIFDRMLKGATYGEIINELNGRGYTTKRGKLFGKNSLYEILRNEKYCGTYVFNKTPKKIAGKRNNRVKKSEDDVIRIEDAIPAIVTQEEWLKVQEIMDGRKHTSKSKSDTVYMLTGILKCGECGGAVTGYSSSKYRNGEKITTNYYVCSKAKKGQCGNKKQYRKDALEEKVLSNLEQDIGNMKDLGGLIENLWNEICLINSTKDEEQQELEKQLKVIEEKMDNITQAVKAGMDIKHLVSEFNELGDQKEYLAHKLQARQSPFANITKGMVAQAVKQKSDIKIDRSRPEECKKIIAENIISATILPNGLSIVLKIQFPGAYNHGVGGPILHYTHHSKQPSLRKSGAFV